MKLDHIALIVSKEENLEFYARFGFCETHRIERGYDTVVFMQCGETALEIFIDPKHPERASKPEAKGLRHIAFATDKFDEIVSQLNNEPIRTDWFGRRFTFVKDPDGQPIEIKENI